ncbi:MAG: ABC transporter permease subunit [Aeromonas sp.]
MLDKNDVYPDTKIPSAFEYTWATFRQNTLAVTGLWALGLLIMGMLFAEWFAPYGMDKQHMHHLLVPPSWDSQGDIDFFFGTDDLGRDMLSRLLLGSRLTLGGALVVTLFVVVVGGALGLLAGMSKGLKSSALQHSLDALLAIPSMAIVVLLVFLLGPGMSNSLYAIALALLPPFVHAVFTAVRAQMQKQYIIASRLDGSPMLRILQLGLLPNISETLVMQITRTLSAALIDISAIGFLGLGARSPHPEWGTMLGSSGDLIYLAPWTVALPGMAIFITILAINFVGEGLRQALNEGVN